MPPLTLYRVYHVADRARIDINRAIAEAPTAIDALHRCLVKLHIEHTDQILQLLDAVEIRREPSHEGEALLRQRVQIVSDSAQSEFTWRLRHETERPNAWSIRHASAAAAALAALDYLEHANRHAEPDVVPVERRQAARM